LSGHVGESSGSSFPRGAAGTAVSRGSGGTCRHSCSYDSERSRWTCVSGISRCTCIGLPPRGSAVTRCSGFASRRESSWTRWTRWTRWTGVSCLPRWTCASCCSVFCIKSRQTCRTRCPARSVRTRGSLDSRGTFQIYRAVSLNVAFVWICSGVIRHDYLL
jgi:hypothetical protein